MSGRAPQRRVRVPARPARKIRGKGAYNVDASYKRTKQARKQAKAQGNYEPSLGRNLLTEGGSMLGGLFGMPGLGKSAGSALSNIFGLGSYEVKENVFMEGRLPQVMNVPSGGGTVIRFQEYISDVITSANIGEFQVNSWLINPANRDTFPFLAQIASNYEQYQLEGLVFEFRSTSGDALNSTNTALGSVIMATQYDVADGIFRSKSEMLNYEYSNSVKPSDNCMHMIECAPSQTSIPILYTLDGSAPQGTDARLYHLGRFNIATIGFQAASVRIGEIHCTYQVRLLKPKIYSALGLDNDYFQVIQPTYTNAEPFGTVISNVSPDYDNFGVTYNSTQIIIPASSLRKQYMFLFYWKGNTTVITAPTVTLSNCSYSGALNQTTSGTSSQEVFQQARIITPGNNAISFITLSASVLPAVGTNAVFRVIEIPADVP